MDAHKRLRDARVARGYNSAHAACEAFNWTYSTYAGHENGARGIRLEDMQRYAIAFGVKPEWLAFGVGKKAEGTDLVANGDSAPQGYPLIPVYDVQASAGHGSLVEYEVQTHSLAFPPDYLKRLTTSSPSHLGIISVKGDSMEPTLLDDDIVLVDTSKKHLGFEGMFLLRLNNTLLVKRASISGRNGVVLLISDNKIYPPVEADLSEVEVVGKVLWYGRKV